MYLCNVFKREPPRKVADSPRHAKPIPPGKMKTAINLTRKMKLIAVR
jgi:hypothetical protein